MLNDVNLVQVVIQGGSVGVAVFALAIMYQLLRMGGKLLDNHLTHIAGALGKLGGKLDRLIDATEKRPRE